MNKANLWPFGKRKNSRDAPQARSTVGVVATDSAWEILCKDGYKPLTACPEVQMCAGVYADLIASMTLHLMQNTPGGDVRVKNELSRKLDISPHGHMTRHTFMSLIVWTLMMHGNQVTIPTYRKGYLEDLQPIPPSLVSFIPTEESYTVMVNGVAFAPDEVLHFMLRPDPEAPYRGMGYGVSLSDVVGSLRQANATKTALMQSPAPSIIVKVDGLSEEFASPTGRAKLREGHLDSRDNRQPWLIPAEAYGIVQVKLLAIHEHDRGENLELDKKAVASIFGVPPFLVGVGDFRKEEFNWFVTTRVLSVAKAIEQELTKGLLVSTELYWRFNNRSLLSYDIGELVTAGSEMVDRMALRRNEWRDWIGLPPDPDMEELLALENYIPANRLGDQAKLTGGGETDAK